MREMPTPPTVRKLLALIDELLEQLFPDGLANIANPEATAAVIGHIPTGEYEDAALWQVTRLQVGRKVQRAHGRRGERQMWFVYEDGVSVAKRADELTSVQGMTILGERRKFLVTHLTHVIKLNEVLAENHPLTIGRRYSLAAFRLALTALKDADIGEREITGQAPALTYVEEPVA